MVMNGYNFSVLFKAKHLRLIVTLPFPWDKKQNKSEFEESFYFIMGKNTQNLIRFILIEDTFPWDKTLHKLSLYAIHKGLHGTSVELFSVKNFSSGVFSHTRL